MLENQSYSVVNREALSTSPDISGYPANHVESDEPELGRRQIPRTLPDSHISLEQAQQMMDDFASVNLDEVAPGKIRVAFSEFVPDGDGYHIETSFKEINTKVPMFAFNNMLANQKRMQRLRKKQIQATEFTSSDEDIDLFDESTILDFGKLTDEQFRQTVNNSEISLLWQAREVLTIWKLTPGEGNMSLKRLMLGLTFEQIQGLFSRFFGAMIRRKQSKA